MAVSIADRRAAFRRLHESGCFVIPNPWDAGSAVWLQQAGFKALASTSSGYAWTLALADNGVGLEGMLAHLKALVAATEIPVNADFENAYADEPQGVAANVLRAAEAGVAGLSVEDSTGRSDKPLYDFDQAVARVTAARQALDKSGSGVLLTARAECFLVGHADPLAESIRRLKAYAAAGADCLYAPGLKTPEQIKAVVDRRGAEAGQCADGRAWADGARARGSRRAPRQHRRRAGASGLAGLHPDGEGDRRCGQLRVPGQGDFLRRARRLLPQAERERQLGTVLFLS